MRACLALVGILALAGTACGDDGNDGNGGNGGDGGTGSSGFTMATFNTGLSPGFVDYTIEREGPVADALANLDADVACVQELVTPEAEEAVTSATAAHWPEALFLEPSPGEEAICTLAELAPLVDCALAACGDLSSQDLATCVVQTCPDQLAVISSDCSSCLSTQLQSDLQTVVETCTPEGGGVGYGGAYGIGLFTDATVTDQDTLHLEASLSRRGVVYARLEPEGADPVHVFCTHLTPVLERIPYPGVGTWEQEQGRQIDALLEWVAQKVPAGERVAILGDLNTGPAGDGWAGQTQSHYDRLLAEGFVNPFTQGPDAACTVCTDNTLVDDDARNTLIDHVLVRDFAGTATGRRILTQTVELDVGGGTETSNLSDHYGVAVTEGD